MLIMVSIVYRQVILLSHTNKPKRKMKKITRLGLLAGLFLSSVFIQSCGGDDPTPVERVYAAGLIDDGKTNYSVGYTKNGVVNVIGGGDVYESANDITFDGTDIYIAGYTNDYANMLYWKNGVKNFVPKDPNLGWEEIQKITVKNGKKYFLAYGPGGINAYRYYVDGVRTILPSQGNANDMAVSSTGDVYVVGRSAGSKAVYWKNGVMEELYNGDSDATAITIVGSDVYISGWYMNEESTPVPVVWKNESMTEIGEPGAYTQDMHVSGNDIYVMGWLTDDSIVMWKNGVMTPVTVEGHSISRIFDIKAKNGNVYFLTRDESTGDALLLKNGELLAPFDGAFQGELTAIALR
jgi:hypothetical protein